VETKNTIPLWLAVAITVCVSLPFGLWLNNWNLPLWASFIVWAEYFALGAKPEALKIMVPAYVLGVVGAVIIVTFSVFLMDILKDAKLVTAGDLAIIVAYFIGFCVLIYAMKWMPVTGGQGTLPFFNGVSMMLGVFFTQATGWVAANLNILGTGDTAKYLVPLLAGVGAILAGLLGAALGWFNVTILFPRQVAEKRSSTPS
jgi:hypothetical protein